jgi:anti-anti-sigma factor
MIDLAKLTFIDSTAIGWMIESQRRSKAAGGKLVLHSATPRVREVFDLLKLGIVLNLKDDEASAKKVVSA